MERHFVAILLACLAWGCAASAPGSVAAPTEPKAPASEPEVDATPEAHSSPSPPADCPPEPPHVWDERAGACRMFPGGGYGWAGCSQAKAPPNGESCVTGTHWQSCDCVCDAAGTAWNVTALRCE